MSKEVIENALECITMALEDISTSLRILAKRTEASNGNEGSFKYD